MAIVDFTKIDEVLKSALDGPGYWAYVFDEPEHVFTDQATPPTHTPSGHWEWIPSARELFEKEAISATSVSGLKTLTETGESNGKGWRAPDHLLSKDDK